MYLKDCIVERNRKLLFRKASRNNPMPEYEGTAVHETGKFLADNNHKQEGDPVKAAASSRTDF